PGLDAADAELDGNVVNCDLAYPELFRYLCVGQLGVGNDCVPNSRVELPDNLLVCFRHWQNLPTNGPKVVLSGLTIFGGVCVTGKFGKFRWAKRSRAPLARLLTKRCSTSPLTVYSLVPATPAHGKTLHDPGRIGRTSRVGACLVAHGSSRKIPN